jgi:lipopolysaccharide export system protein LptA
MKSPIAMAAVMALAALAVQPAAAQPAGGQTAAGQTAATQPANHSKGPIDVTADHLETHNTDCTAIWTGSAEALQDTSRLRADKMIAHLEIKKGGKSSSSGPGSTANSDCGQMISLEAIGRVYYVSPDGRRVHGDNGFYDSASTTMTITGDVTAVQGQNVMRGTKMVYNTDTGEGHVEGTGTGQASKTRPRGVFYPKDTADQGDTTQGAAGNKPKKKAAK